MIHLAIAIGIFFIAAGLAFFKGTTSNDTAQS